MRLVKVTFWKGNERSVSQVPGWSATTQMFCRRRANSRLMHLLSWFCALLLALLPRMPFVSCCQCKSSLEITLIL